MNFFALSLTALALVTGCAANSGVISMAQDSYMVSRQAATGFSGSGNLKAEAITEAGQYCNLRGKTVQLSNAIEAQPPYVLGNFPKAEIQFKCI